MCPSRVIALVLDTTSHEFLTFDNNLLAVGSVPRGVHTRRARSEAESKCDRRQPS